MNLGGTQQSQNYKKKIAFSSQWSTKNKSKILLKIQIDFICIAYHRKNSFNPFVPNVACEQLREFKDSQIIGYMFFLYCYDWVLFSYLLTIK